MMKEKLYNFIKSYCGEDTNKFDKVVRKGKVQLLLGNKLKEHSLLLYAEYLMLCRSQKEKNIIYPLVIYQLMEKFYEAGVSPIFLKGYFLARDLYENIDERQTNDIDILIDAKDFVKCHHVFIDLGFSMHSHSGFQISDFSMLENEIKDMHIVYNCLYRNIQVMVELHGAIINPRIIFQNDLKFFSENARKESLRDLTASVLNLEYNFVYLNLHFFKHLPLSYFENVMFGKSGHFEMKNLHDVALLVEKYNNVMDWEEIVKICVRGGVVKAVIMTSNFVNEIYGNIIPESFLDQLEMNRHYSYLSSGNFDFYGLGKFLPAFVRFVDKYYDHLSIINLFEDTWPEGMQLSDIMSFNSLILLDNPYKKKFKKIINETEALYESEIVLNKDRIVINVDIQGKDCCTYCGENYIFDSDGIEVIFVTGQHIIHCIYSIIKLENGNYSFIKYSNNDEEGKIRKLTKEIFSIDVSTKRTKMEISIPLECFEININEVLFCNCAVIIAMGSPSKLFATEKLLSNGSYIWNFDE